MKDIVQKITNVLFFVLAIPAILLVTFSCSYMAVDYNYANATGMFGTYIVEDASGNEIGAFKSSDDISVGDSIAFFADTAENRGDYVWSLFDPASDEMKNVAVANLVVVDTVSSISGNTITSSQGFTTTTDLVVGEATDSAGLAGIFATDGVLTWAWVLIALLLVAIWIDLLFKNATAEEKEEKERAKKEKAEKEAAEKEAKEKAAKEKAEKEAAEKEKADRIAAAAAIDKERADKEAKEKADKEAKEKAAAAAILLATQKKEKEEKEAAEKAEKERLAKEKAEKEAAEKAEKERIAKEKAAAAAILLAQKQKEKEEKEAAEKAEKERLAKEKAEKEAAEKAEKERIAKEKAAAAAILLAQKQKEKEEKEAAEKAEKERKEKEKEEARKAKEEEKAKKAAAAAALLALKQKEKEEKEAAEKAERERIAKEKAEKEAAEKAEKERLAEEKRQKTARMTAVIAAAAVAAKKAQEEEAQKEMVFEEKYIDEAVDSTDYEEVYFTSDFFDRLGEVTRETSMITANEIRKFVGNSVKSDLKTQVKNTGRDKYKLSLAKTDYGYVHQTSKTVIMEVNLPVKYAESISEAYGITSSVVVDAPNWYNWVLSESTTTEQVANVICASHFFACYKYKKAEEQEKTNA